MAWDLELPLVLRALVNDLDAVTFTDDRLLQVLVVAAFQVGQELTFRQKYTAKVSDVDLSPDPTEGPGRDDGYANLVTIKAACILDRGAAVVAANRAISVKDGSSAIDLREVFGAKLKLLEKGWCAVYEDERVQHLMGQGGVVTGAVVLSPFRLYAYGAFSSYTTVPGPAGAAGEGARGRGWLL